MIIKNWPVDAPVNVFAGAGISRKYPSRAPVWREMVSSFLESLFQVMHAESWSALENYSEELGHLHRYYFRPETFWGRVLNLTNIEFVSSCLRVIDQGKSNSNHAILSHMVRVGIVSNIVTTNFDEYLERAMQGRIHRVVKSGDINVDNRAPLDKVLFKIHGTISDSVSLQFTLEHTKNLGEWKTGFLKQCLIGKPLIIIGYSGYDDDILPVLHSICPEIPSVCIVSHPGSRAEEPIRSLQQYKNVTRIEADISEVLLEWHQHRKPDGSTQIPSQKDVSKTPLDTGTRQYFQKVLHTLPMPVLPVIASDIFELASHVHLAKKYAFLADDAADDSRYSELVTPALKKLIDRNLSIKLAVSGDKIDGRMSGFFGERVNQDEGSIAQIMANHLNHTFAYFLAPRITTEQEEEIEKYASAALKMMQAGAIGGDFIRVKAYWNLGRLKLYQKEPEASVAYYEQIGEALGCLSNLELSWFMLDFGLAYFNLSLKTQSDEMLEKARKAYSNSERLAVKNEDHQTSAKAKMNLSSVYLLAGQKEISERYISEAIVSAARTGDLGLQERAKALFDAISNY